MCFAIILTFQFCVCVVGIKQSIFQVVCKYFYYYFRIGGPGFMIYFHHCNINGMICRRRQRVRR